MTLIIIGGITAILIVCLIVVWLYIRAYSE